MIRFRVWGERLPHTRRRVGSTIAVGTTEFTVQFLGAVWPALRAEFKSRGVQLKIEHVRTRDLWARLDAKHVDLVLGSLAAEYDRPVTLDYDFIEWHRERVALLTNLSARELPDKPVVGGPEDRAAAGALRRPAGAVPRPLVRTGLPRRPQRRRGHRLLEICFQAHVGEGAVVVVAGEEAVEAGVVGAEAHAVAAG
ncbi:hypothetical protein [Saccharothrix hoggarensis]